MSALDTLIVMTPSTAHKSLPIASFSKFDDNLGEFYPQTGALDDKFGEFYSQTGALDDNPGEFDPQIGAFEPQSNRLTSTSVL